MNTFLKVLLILLVVAVVVHCWPVLAVPFAILLVPLVVVGAVLLGGLSLAAGIAIAVIGAVVGLAAGLFALLSPVLIPVLLVAGIIALVRHSRRTA